MDLSLGNSVNSLIDSANGRADGERVRRLSELSGTGRGTRQDLEKAAQEFEGVFLNQLMKAMRATVPENKFFNSGGPTKFYQQMYDAELSKALADGHTGMGIRDLIVQQFEAHVDADQADDAGTAGPSPAETLFGPPAPAPASEALDRYRAMSPVVGEVAALARLRQRAADQGSAVADTLRRFEDEITTAARAVDLDPALVLSVVMVESGGDPGAVSHKGALGLMQLMPGTALEVGVDDPADPRQNLAGGARYLARMLDRFQGDLDLALAAYNAGPGNVDRAGRQVPAFPETQRYVQAVKDRFTGLSDGTNLAPDGR